ncbi:hypothetical protein OsJ_05189 [Oryza sativa Japonica Group]|uniref:Endoglucanase n=1 Tax=Oryza sativa subsp. japonica TaxID=39947 RepID=A3A2M2_ORYSJ|nr:hypothetical protein OsJ_05189 [Oryza sativa Japonica Group]
MSRACLLLVVAAVCLAGREAAAFNYADALDKAILFFEAQRSGKLPPGQRVAWRADSGLSDGSADGVDLAGGYYDAGDNVKFGLPMAFTVTMLSWSVIEFGDMMPARRSSFLGGIFGGGGVAQLDNARAARAVGRRLPAQGGDGDAGHPRPEDMDTPRSVYKVTPQSPGSDVAGETAAALAAASIVFRVSDPSYSAKLLDAAQLVFDFADKYRGSYSDSLSSVVCPFYCSHSYHDELLWAASWLHLASPEKKDVYLSYIGSNGHALGAEQDDFTFSWDDKRVATKGFLQSRADGLQLYKAHTDNYICSLVPGANGFQSQYTPGGLLFKEGDSNMQYVTSTAFLLLTYAKYLSSSAATVSCGSTAVSPSTLISLAKKQVDYILGANPAGMSYMVGFGARYPRHVHHRGASMPSVRDHPARIGCDEGFRYLHSPEPDRNLLAGAVVGGPDAGDAFADGRDNYAQAEPSTYTNAPLVGALAFFAGAHKIFTP